MEGSVVDVFASGAYWRAYYTSLGQENREVGEFLAEVTRESSTGGGLRILDAGCGPTLLYWALFAAGHNELYGFDLSHANIADTHRRIAAVRTGIVDAGLLEASRHAVSLYGGIESAEERVADKARQVVGIKVADLSKPWPYAAEKFDMVQSIFAMEALDDWDAFHRAMIEARLVLRPGGSLIMANTAHGNEWTCEGQNIRTLYVTADELRWRLADAGFALETLRDIQSSDVDWRDQGYSQVLLTKAVKT